MITCTSCNEPNACVIALCKGDLVKGCYHWLCLKCFSLVDIEIEDGKVPIVRKDV